MPCVHDCLRHAAALARILRDQTLQMRCIQPTLKIQRQHFLLERRACDICIEFCKDQPLFKPAGNEQITEAQTRHERLGKQIQVQHGIAVVQTAECLARATVKCQILKTVVLNDRKAVFLRQRQQLPTFALAPADIRRAPEIRHRVVKIKGRLIEHGAHSVHIWPIRQQRDGHYPRTGALEAMQRDRIAGILGEHDRILADKRLADRSMPCWLPLTIRIFSSAAAMLRAARCCRSACVSADSAGAHPAAAARARRPARQIAVSPPASPAACWWQNHRPARSPTARPENCRAPRRRQRTRNYPAAGHNTRCLDSGGYNRCPPANHTPFPPWRR